MSVASGNIFVSKVERKIDLWNDKLVVFVANFQFVIQSEEDLRKLNFSRDMLAGMDKNIIFLTTPYGDDMLSRGAYDFYSFIKMRVLFSDYEEKNCIDKTDILPENKDKLQKEWDAEEIKEKMEDAYVSIQDAKELLKNAKYAESERLLIKVKEIREKILGTEHLETAEVYQELVHVYLGRGIYKAAEGFCKKALEVRKIILGEEHPQTVSCYNDLAHVYKGWGRYKDAEEVYRNVLEVGRNVLGEEHPQIAVCYTGLAQLFEKLGKYDEATNSVTRSTPKTVGITDKSVA